MKETVKHHLRCSPHQAYLARSRHYLEKRRTKKWKLEKIDDHVVDMFERTQKNALPAHDIDLRQWTLKKTMDESLDNFVASDHWLSTFKNKHTIISRKVTKVRDM